MVDNQGDRVATRLAQGGLQLTKKFDDPARISVVTRAGDVLEARQTSEPGLYLQSPNGTVKLHL